MTDTINRREFIETVGSIAAGALALPAVASAASLSTQALRRDNPTARMVMRTFDYSGVSLLASRWRKQYDSARDFYLGVSDEDILHGTDNPTVFRFKGQVEASQRDDFMPFYQFAELERYRMYFDPSMRTDLW